MTYSDMIRALFVPFEKALLAYPSRAFMVRAEVSDGIDTAWRSRLVCEQSFRPAYNRLIAAGYETLPQLAGTFDVGLCLLTKHKAENRANIARAWSLLSQGGVLVCCGANALGAASIEREVDRALGLDGHLSKHQSRVFWVHRRDGPMPEMLQIWLDSGSPIQIADGDFVARAGCFSHDHVDTGSRLLADHVPARIEGRVADLGAGWGYLSVRLLQEFPAITSIDLYEAEALALDDAKTNIRRLVPKSETITQSYWNDVSTGLADVPPYDWIISNPPFHDGKKADPTIGRAFITAAWKAIRRRGKFLLVANQSLPYEAELRRRFREVELLKAADGFKIYLSSDRIDHS